MPSTREVPARPKERGESAAIPERFERGLRNALATSPEKPRKKAKRKKKR